MSISGRLPLPPLRSTTLEMFESTIEDRFPIIERHIRTGSVLDLGCVDARNARETAQERIEHKPNFLFKRIVETNKDTLGIDIDPAGVEVLRSMGYNVQCADVETMDLGRQFDAIVAGEIIEHLDNPGLFLRNMRRHLKPSGVLIVSTPNPFYQNQVWKIWRYGRPAVHEDHANWQDPTTLNELFRRSGLEAIEGYWVQPSRSTFKTWKRLFRGYFSHGFMMLARPRS
jgi:2-polyprenyl-3-methyl-5-hydroxy-6-metoxy-1,4-benzoquinol methylase